MLEGLLALPNPGPVADDQRGKGQGNIPSSHRRGGFRGVEDSTEAQRHGHAQGGTGEVDEALRGEEISLHTEGCVPACHEAPG